MLREILFSVTAKDCKFDYYSGSGAGGQARNKSLSAARCTHIASGAMGNAQDSRSQKENKMLAFRRMAESPKFLAWHKIETARMLGKYVGLEEEVDNLLRPDRIRVEIQKNGKWVPENENGDSIDAC